MQRIALSIIGGLILVVAAAALTEVTLAVGHRSTTTDEATLTKPSPTASPSPSATPTPTATPSATPVPTPAPVPTATTNITVRLRAQPTTASAQLAWIAAGTTVTLGTYVDASWQEVTVNGLHGYIWRAYLTY